MKVLHLNLKKKWFDLIASGEKKEEYRMLKLYWAVRLLHGFSKADISLTISDLIKPYETTSGATLLDAVKKEFDVIIFKNGYAKNARTMTLEFKGIEIGKAKSEWSDNWQGNVFIIKLGEIINQNKK